MVYGIYRGGIEEDPGKMKFRHKGSFLSEKVARAHQHGFAIRGIRAKVVKMKDEAYPYHLYVMAKHDFWKKNFIINTRK